MNPSLLALSCVIYIVPGVRPLDSGQPEGYTNEPDTVGTTE